MKKENKINEARKYLLENGYYAGSIVSHESIIELMVEYSNLKIEEEQSKKTVTDEEIEKEASKFGKRCDPSDLTLEKQSDCRYGYLEGAKWMRDQLNKQDNICTDTGKICKYNCSGLCKERC